MAINNSGASKAKNSPKYHAVITYTKYGVPHITASSFKNLGFGIGFAQSKENLCTLSDQILKIKSERSIYFGIGE
ncbi:penicillin acylase family protein [Shewanella sp. 202IG2-18]|uniref:penicillin acylase family protein n=1 Tax=Parashewanella hymeniacidonis TaxID=2807618 RepID=UPI00195F98EE|nr:penicillin acylase family protein [Parashewanella hymeniacidonis]